MSPVALLQTATLLGLFVLAGGAYAGLYAAGRLQTRSGLVLAGRACWLAALAIAVVIALFTPLHSGWKLLVLGSAVGYAVIPPITWHYLERTHHESREAKATP